MNNVKTNRTFEQFWPVSNGNTPERKAAHRAWNMALESVVQEPGLTEADILARIERWGRDAEMPYEGHWEDLAYCIATNFDTEPASHIPASKPAPQPQEGLTREWLGIWNLQQESLDMIWEKHEASLSTLRVELDEAKKGRYAIPSVDDWPEESINGGPVVAVVVYYTAQPESFWRESTDSNLIAYIPKNQTPTVEQMMEAWVKWRFDKHFSEVFSKGHGAVLADSWAELAQRQANGETIDQIYAEIGRHNSGSAGGAGSEGV